MEAPVSLSETGEIDQGKHGSSTELVVMTVEIGDGRKDVIRIHIGDDPDELAQVFAHKHGLDPHLQQNLALLIRQNKETVEARALPSPEPSKWHHMPPQSPFFSQEETIKSMKPASSKPVGTVFDRLYGHRTKKQAPAKEEPAKSKSSATINYGEWLYIKGVKSREALTSKAEKKTEPVHAHRPLINEYSKLLSPRYFERTEDLLLRKGETYKDHRADLKARKLEADMQECTFTPKILSSGLSKDNTLPKYELLYNEAEQRRLRREETAPQTSQKVPRSTADAIVQRLLSSKKEFEQKMEQARQDKAAQELSLDGRPLFSPKTGKTPSSRTAGNIFEHLYAMKDKKPAPEPKQPEGYKVTRQSAEIASQFKGKQYGRLFSLLDGEGTGSLSSETICIDGIDAKVLDTLTPVFKRLDEGAVLDINAFVSFMEEYWPKMTPDQRGILMKRPSNRIPQNESVASPPFAKAGRKQREELYDRLVSSQKITSLMAEKTKQMREEEEVKQCTFKPTINKSRRPTQKRY